MVVHPAVILCRRATSGKAHSYGVYRLPAPHYTTIYDVTVPTGHHP